jgi:hypothetical protein
VRERDNENNHLREKTFNYTIKQLDTYTRKQQYSTTLSSNNSSKYTERYIGLFMDRPKQSVRVFAFSGTETDSDTAETGSAKIQRMTD